MVEAEALWPTLNLSLRKMKSVNPVKMAIRCSLYAKNSLKKRQYFEVLVWRYNGCLGPLRLGMPVGELFFRPESATRTSIEAPLSPLYRKVYGLRYVRLHL